MSCNGCRVLRKGCSEDCMLRHCLLWIENPQAQANATLFVAKFFGRATLMSFLSSVPTNQRSALFQSLLYEAVGRTINPVNGAVGLLWTGNWHLCQVGVEKVLRGDGGSLTPLPHFYETDIQGFESLAPSCHSRRHHHQQVIGSGSRMILKNHELEAQSERVVVGSGRYHHHQHQAKKQRAGTPSEESESSTLGSRAEDSVSENERQLLPLFF